MTFKMLLVQLSAICTGLFISMDYHIQYTALDLNMCTFNINE